ncbi:MAG: amidase domain-containing protein [Betaproteobacteria bacterium]
MRIPPDRRDPRKRGGGGTWALIAALLVGAAVAGARFAWPGSGVWPGQAAPPRTPAARAVVSALEDVFDARAAALVRGDLSLIEPHYETDGPASARKALQHEARKLRYVQAWASKRGVAITAADAHLQVKSVVLGRGTANTVVWQSLNVRYRPSSRPAAADSVFGIRTRHKITLVRKASGWLVRSDEYTDPLGEDTLVPEVAPAASLEPADPVEFVYPPPGPLDDQAYGAAAAAPSLGRTSWRQLYNRKRAVAYADRYCGVKVSPGAEFGYNPLYLDYTDMGGDCTNFVSQVLGDSKAGGIPHDSAWYYDYTSSKGGSRAWVETDALAAHLTESGMARLLARGSFRDVQAPTQRFPRGALALLEPGDIIAYEEKGEIQHFAVITARDPSGYPLVNTHTADRYHVPWDLGWDKNTVFWLFKIVR